MHSIMILVQTWMTGHAHLVRLLYETPDVGEVIVGGIHQCLHVLGGINAVLSGRFKIYIVFRYVMQLSLIAFARLFSFKNVKTNSDMRRNVLFVIFMMLQISDHRGSL